MAEIKFEGSSATSKEHCLERLVRGETGRWTKIFLQGGCKWLR